MDSWAVQAMVIGIGGFLGANVRAFVSSYFAVKVGLAFPYGTAFINITGSFAIGLILAFIGTREEVPPIYRLFFVTGFLGAYTTFSTFSYESLMLFEQGNYVSLVFYVGGSVLLGLVAVAAGAWVGRLFGG